MSDAPVLPPAVRIGAVTHSNPGADGATPADRLPVDVGPGPNNVYESIVVRDTNGVSIQGKLDFQVVIPPGLPGAGTPVAGIFPKDGGGNAANGNKVEIEVNAVVPIGDYDIIVWDKRDATRPPPGGPPLPGTIVGRIHIHRR